ncbi:MAG: hypothetical protein HYS07_06200, partial [Chlamydiae bacterium]|nr:hypothetical protein [Chlamydiota bacterium]
MTFALQRPLKVHQNKTFIGRRAEMHRFQEIEARQEASLVVVYGRRRVGKTELIEQYFRERRLIKFEGLEGASPEAQISHFLYQLSKYTKDPLVSQLKFGSWLEVLDFLGDLVLKGKWTLYFEEIQWLANYSDTFISALKYVWDNKLRHNKELILILCGSSPSFIINKIFHSRALYNRSQYPLLLKEFNLQEIRDFLGPRRSPHEIMDACLTTGGIPEYLKYLKTSSSIFLSLSRESFRQGGFFTDEDERIFISSLAKNPNYQRIIEFLGKRKFSTRDEIAKYLKIKPGGNLTELLKDLETCGFISRYVPYYLKPESMLSRYCITDSFLQFHAKFIRPIKKRIARGDYDEDPTRALPKESYQKWLGFAFERFCQKSHRIFSNVLGFSAVQYRCGPFFSRRTDELNPGYQIDLLFDRDDKVLTVCEIKYTEAAVGTEVINEMDRKLELLLNPKKKSIQRILIAPFGATKA